MAVDPLNEFVDLEALERQVKTVLSQLDRVLNALEKLRGQGVDFEELFLNTKNLPKVKEDTEKFNEAVRKTITIEAELERIERRKAALDTQIIALKTTAAKEEAKLAIEKQRVRKETELAARAELAEAGSLEQMRVKLIQVSQQYAAMGEEKRNSAEGAFKLGQVSALDAEVKRIEFSMGNFRRNVGNYANSIREAIHGIEGQIAVLIREYEKLPDAMKRATQGQEIRDNIAALRGEVDKNRKALAAIGQQAENTGSQMKSAFKSFATQILGALGLTALFAKSIQLMKRFVSLNADLDDALSDVRKTTGLTDEAVRALNDDLAKINTRSSQKELLELATIAGKLGIEGKEDILGFVRAADQIKIALAKDLGDNVEEAVNSIGKLTDLFKLKDQLGIEQSMLKTGSAINALGAASSASESYLVDFTRRLGGVAPQADISIENVLGLGATLDQLGQVLETSSTAVTQLLTKMFQNPAEYARIAGIEVERFSEMLRQDANEALILFLSGLNKNQGGLAELAVKFKDLGIDGSRAIGVVGALSGNVDLLRESQKLANDEFRKGTSLTNEFNIKNNNLAGNLAKIGKAIKNSFINSAFSESLRDIVGSMAKWVEVPVSETLQKESRDLNVLVSSIIAANKNTQIRAGLLTELNDKYPSFLENLNKEKVTNEQLRDRLKEVNAEYLKRIKIAVVEEDIQRVEENILSSQRQQRTLLKGISDAYVQMVSVRKEEATVEEMILAIGKRRAIADQQGTQIIEGALSNYNRYLSLNNKINASIDERTKLLEEQQKIGPPKPQDTGTAQNVDDPAAAEAAAQALKEREEQEKKSAETRLKLENDLAKAKIELISSTQEREKALLIQSYAEKYQEIDKQEKENPALSGKYEELRNQLKQKEANDLLEIDQKYYQESAKIQLEMLGLSAQVSKDTADNESLSLQTRLAALLDYQQKRTAAIQNQAALEIEQAGDNAEKIKAIEQNAAYEVQKVKREAESQTIALSKVEYEKRFQESIRIISDQSYEEISILQDQYAAGLISYEGYLQKREEIIKRYQEQELLDSVYGLKLELIKRQQAGESTIEIEQQIFEAQKKLRDNDIADYEKYISAKVDLEKGFAELKDQLLIQASETATSFLQFSVDSQLTALDQQARQDQEAKERELEAAGDNKEAKEKIEQKYKRKEELREKEKAKLEQRAEIFQRAGEVFKLAVSTFRAIGEIQLQAAILASNPITAALAPLALAQIPVALGISALQAAAIVAQPLPKYAVGRTDGPPETAVVGEKGSEVIELPGGKMYLTPGEPTITYLPAHAKVIPNDEIERRFSLHEAFEGRDLQPSEKIKILEHLRQNDVSSTLDKQTREYYSSIYDSRKVDQMEIFTTENRYHDSVEESEIHDIEKQLSTIINKYQVVDHVAATSFVSKAESIIKALPDIREKHYTPALSYGNGERNQLLKVTSFPSVSVTQLPPIFPEHRIKQSKADIDVSGIRYDLKDLKISLTRAIERIPEWKITEAGIQKIARNGSSIQEFVRKQLGF